MGCFNRLINFFCFGFMLAWGLALGPGSGAANSCGSQGPAPSHCPQSARGQWGTAWQPHMCQFEWEHIRGTRPHALRVFPLLRKRPGHEERCWCLHPVMKFRKGSRSSSEDWTQLIPCLAGSCSLKTHFYLSWGFKYIPLNCYESC